ncbi:ParA family protein [Rhodococcus sp. ARC_M5]|uniref:ParA family protein n=1 Tax=Rhodococcus sp. ARC_M5 TaxID=2928851 RepID=UPI001FB240BE|nr:AAA family ATPase [Rhodococcus sp. ARC_M5]MCJ0893761.1 AAA family ATPase [Rhodococcus sp. ARC_M5]
MKSIAFFNNKGGVGKTTLAVNMAYYLSTKRSARVLFVDCDPQCNSTQILLSESEWGDIYSNSSHANDRTILKTIHQLRIGNSEIDKNIPVIRSKNFKVDVLAGHPFLSLLEDILSESWTSFAGGNYGAAVRSHWASQLVDSANYDFVIFDVGPSLGALNRSVLIGSDVFITPVSPDLFSLYSFDNLKTWFTNWSKTYSRGVAATLSENPDLESGRIQMWEHPGVRAVFAGYTTQEYLTRSTEGKARTVQAYDLYKKQIPERAQLLAKSLGTEIADYDLGVVPYMFSMVPLAQTAHAPIFGLTSSDGLTGAQFSQQKRYSVRLAAIGDRLLENLASIEGHGRSL